MGDVKKSVKGNDDNLIGQLDDFLVGLSECIEQKDLETVSEGDDEKAENIRKASLLRSAYSLVNGAKTILEAY